MAWVPGFLRRAMGGRRLEGGKPASTGTDRALPIYPHVDTDRPLSPIPLEGGVREPFKPALDFGRPQGETDEREFGAPEDLRDFLFHGLALMVDSSWLESAKYDSQAQVLTVVFQDGFVQPYEGCDLSHAVSFAQAPSKGSWLHVNVKAGYQGRYWILRPPFRHG